MLTATKAGAKKASRVRKDKGFKAWILTWEYQGWEKVCRARHRGPSRVAAVLHKSCSNECVTELVRSLYMSEFGTPQERLEAARSRSSDDPPVDFGRLHGAPWNGRIRCGGTPYLYARRVEELRLSDDDKARDEFTWKEIRLS